MAALDTKVIVRWLVKDDAAQTARVQTLLDARLREQQTLFVPVTVLLETEWVLRSRYRFDKASITAALDALLSTTELEFESEPAAEKALWQFKQAAAADFADCLLVVRTIDASYEHPAFLGQKLHVTCVIRHLREAYSVWETRIGNGQMKLCSITAKLVCLGANGRTLRTMPDELLHRLSVHPLLTF